MALARVTAFNNLLRDIINLVSNKFPEDKDVAYTKSQIELAISVSPRGTISGFMKETKPYLEKILHKDEDFFLNMINDSKGLQGLAINDKWTYLNTVEKDRLWKNVQKMVVLGNKIMSED